ncbi:acetate--CoA ligase family protein [Massilia cavernae]|uniref:CoA-binding protein n=1 Tax=Massilia cavernae TaxID=2320864 RepID=A0A418Y5N0_9BURK|nr:acetate--CoA ligase family protein [Massilia cavernae]RJG22071.1 CoA-binding protein [Massilia cavernae]
MNNHQAPITQASLGRLLRPRSIALIGVSAEPGSAGGAVLSNLERFGYQGNIHLVSRTQKEVHGRPCVASVDDLPHGVDVAVLGVPQAAILGTLESCAARGVGAALVFASGFAETDAAGKAAQLELATVAGRNNLPVLGPNCLGFVNYIDNVPLTFEAVPPTKGAAGVAVLAQSGAMAANIRMALVSRGCPVAYAISTGNEAVVAVEDLLEWLIDDPHTHAISLLVEQIRNPERFLALAEKAMSHGKPLVMLHPGRSERARDAAMSHTGAMAGNYSIMAVLAAASGVVHVDTLDELFDVTLLLNRFPSGAAGGTAILTNSGACKGVALDFAEAIGLELPLLAPETVSSLQALLPAFASAENPLDITTAGMKDASLFGTTAMTLLDDPGVGSLVVTVMGGSPGQQLAKANALVPCLSKSTKPAVIAYMGDDSPLAEGLSDVMRAGAVPFFRSPERAMRAMRALANYWRVAQTMGSREAGPQVPAAEFPRRGLLAEYQAKALLAPLGLAMPRGGLAKTVNEAIDIAREIGYPVVMKAQAPELPHKSDVGGVAIKIADAAGVRDAWERIRTSVLRARPELELDGLLVESMAPSGLEMVVGARRDPEWGAVVLIGLGGIWIETLKDFRLIPVAASRQQVLAEIEKLRGAALLHGTRGAPALDIEALADSIMLLAAVMRANPELVEIDINPLVVFEAGKGVLALDALMVTRS